MATLVQLQARLEALKVALATGVLIIQHGDTRTQYRTIDEIKTAIGAVQEDIAAAGGESVIRSFKLTSSKDL